MIRQYQADLKQALKSLKLCPFCDSESHLKRVESGHFEPPYFYFVNCKNLDCLARGPRYKNELGAIARWNQGEL